MSTGRVLSRISEQTTTRDSGIIQSPRLTETLQEAVKKVESLTRYAKC